MKHTPGPWQTSKLGPSSDGSQREMISNGRFIAEVATSDEQQQANARLIAAAPELLENLIGVTKALSRLIDKYDPDSIEAEWIGNANDAILKAS